jgi:hypothetical protein
MLHKICPHITRRAVREQQLQSESPEKRPKKTLAHCTVNLEFLESILGKIFGFRSSELLSSRIKFKI